ncbi:flagellin N-terminal helical domain-containing protein [Pelagibacterium mangrovi]|uniref:flagellin N-terminal helical domain-containing protein n=1 Tax=Pelagibacterium mangrovi TaxID=3119828 RepID=UPI002FCAA5F9
MSDITLSKAVRSNLLSLQNTAEMMASTQNRLATGKKVNSALDNPVNFFTASSLNSRAGDMNALLDDMANGIQTLEAADNGLTAITKTLESMQSTLRQARQDKSFETASFDVSSTATGELSFTKGAFGNSTATVAVGNTTLTDAALGMDTAIDGTAGTAGPPATAGSADITWGATEAVEVNSGAKIAFTATIDGVAQSIEITQDDVLAIGNNDNMIDDADEFTALLNAKLSGATATNASGTITVVSATTGTTSDVDLSVATITGTAYTADDIVSAINGDAVLSESIRASNDNGKLRIENLSTQDLEITGASSSAGVTGGTTNTAKIGGNDVRADLATQYNELRDQLDKLADDASFNGINLLRGDNLKITFNETGTSDLEIQSRIDGENGVSINSATLGIDTNMSAAELDSDEGIDGFLAQVKSAINTVRSQASAFGSSLSIVENRQNFSKNMINTLQTGASNLTLADANEEAANLLALQTRQQLSSTALSMASQSDQAVLRLF